MSDSLTRREFVARSALGAAAALTAPLLPSCASAGGRGATTEVTGPFQPTWASLAQYHAPAWFRDAKLGIWAHWGPQCQPERGDWYARQMYQEGSDDYKDHVARYGHPSKSGFKDVIHEWKAESWDPEALVAFYQSAGAQYFFALANHHDNLDLWDSRYQSWNSVRVGPRKNLIEGWARAARRHGLPFGVSVHASHAWSWYEPAQGADRTGPLVGVPYDGKLTRADGAGRWWQGLDPQELYAQSHVPSPDFLEPRAYWTRWDWSNGASIPDAAYCEKFYRRTLDLIDRYDPDLLYFDDTALPLWPISDVGLRLAAHYYNRSMRRHGGELRAVLFGKVLDEEQRRCMVWDIERGQANRILPQAWQTDTCLGNWHYDRPLYERNGYKSATMVVHMLVDIVSKNGNLLLNVPVRGDGTIDEQERAIVEGLGAWMRVHREAIIGTRPWRVFGEGPALEGAALQAQGFNEGKGRPFTADDLRFTTRGDTLYAIALGWPANGELVVKSLADGAAGAPGTIRAVRLLGNPGDLRWTRDGTGLRVSLPDRRPGDHAYALEITGLSLRA
jgi:alpha-L-fucosidase